MNRNRPSTLDIANSTNPELRNIETQMRGAADSVVKIGKLWASHGLRIAESALVAAEHTLKETSRALDELHDAVR